MQFYLMIYHQALFCNLLAKVLTLWELESVQIAHHQSKMQLANSWLSMLEMVDILCALNQAIQEYSGD